MCLFLKRARLFAKIWQNKAFKNFDFIVKKKIPLSTILHRLHKWHPEPLQCDCSPATWNSTHVLNNLRGMSPVYFVTHTAAGAGEVTGDNTITYGTAKAIFRDQNYNTGQLRYFDRPPWVHGDYCNWTIDIFLGWFTMSVRSVERFYSRGQQLCKFIGTKESFYIRKRFNTKRIGLEHQHGRPTWPPLYCFGTAIWRTWSHVKTLYKGLFSYKLEWILEYSWTSLQRQPWGQKKVAVFIERWPL